MPDRDLPPPFSRWAIDEWSLRDRLETLTCSVNTLSRILILLECGADPPSVSDIRSRIATEAFATAKYEFDTIGYGTIQSKL